MPRLTKKALAFADQYEADYPQVKEMASRVEELVKSIVGDIGISVHLASSRAKDPGSMRAKLRRRLYTKPQTQITDQLGVRVITYYKDDVDRVVKSLKTEFRIDDANSVDKRRALDLRSFGYRSVHLIARLKPPRAAMAEYAPLAGVWFEIQVRSVLEHAWAEIEHQIVYKAGIQYPQKTLRLFAALAGTLEILDVEFEALRTERERLIDGYKIRYLERKDGGRRLDVARLLGYLEANWPDAPGWLPRAAEDASLPEGFERSCVEALEAVGLKTADALHAHMQSRSFRRAIELFAAANGIESATVSQLARVVLAVATKDPKVFQSSFKEMAREPSVAAVMANR